MNDYPHEPPHDSGLNLHAVFEVVALPDAIRDLLARAAGPAAFRQLHLFGHGGPAMWQALQASDFVDHADPVDAFSAAVVRQWFESIGARHLLLYPAGEVALPLQQLGELAGWHHRSPFMVGVNDRWGSWYAYRAVALADTDLPLTKRQEWGASCAACTQRPCLAACPAAALLDEANRLRLCIDYRLRENSPCARQCLARNACSTGAEYRYSEEQIRYHYGRSLQTIRAWRQQTEQDACS